MRPRELLRVGTDLASLRWAHGPRRGRVLRPRWWKAGALPRAGWPFAPDQRRSFARPPARADRDGTAGREGGAAASRRRARHGLPSQRAAPRGGGGLLGTPPPPSPP